MYQSKKRNKLKFLEDIVVEFPHTLWIGCGDLLRRCVQGLQTLRESHGGRLSFVDIVDADKVRGPVPVGADYFNIQARSERSRLRTHLQELPITHVFIANWAPHHLLTAFKFSELCNNGRIVLSKPLDTNFQLIKTVAGGGWTDLTEKLWVHDHYRNKAAIEPLYNLFPDLIDRYGELKPKGFEFYLVEHRTVEDEGRLDALNDGVIFDLASHLFAYVQMFLLEPPYPALQCPGKTLVGVRLSIDRVTRARYANCKIANQNAETFAAIELSVHVRYRLDKAPPSRKPEKQCIKGLLVVGKGVKPSLNANAGLKGMRFHQQLQPRSVNVATNVISPLLQDAEAVSPALPAEDGFNAPLVNALRNRREQQVLSGVPSTMSFSQAAENSLLLERAIKRGANNMFYYTATDTLSTVLSQCVHHGLDKKWLSGLGYGDMVYSN
jgi:hypothetical protein